MRKFSEYRTVNETCVTSDVNPGNALSNTGVTNHLTPVGNIVTQIRNIFSPLTGVVASIGEDGYSVKLNSSKFTSEEEVNNMLHSKSIMKGTTLANYIISQGLPVVKIVPVGDFMIVYFSPDDIKNAKVPKEPQGNPAPVKEMLERGLEEVEMLAFIKESDDDEEIEDKTSKKIRELIKSKDKVKSAKELELMLTQQLELPREYYFAGVKSKDGDESIALRWKYTKRRRNEKHIEAVRSLLNIYDDSKEGIWVQDFDDKGIVKLPKEVDKLIHTVLDFLGASETNDPCVFSLDEADKKEKKEDKEKDDDKDDEKKDDEKVDIASSSDSDEDNEDDNSRGDSSDDNK